MLYLEKATSRTSDCSPRVKLPSSSKLLELHLGFCLVGINQV